MKLSERFKNGVMITVDQRQESTLGRKKDLNLKLVILRLLISEGEHWGLPSYCIVGTESDVGGGSVSIQL